MLCFSFPFLFCCCFFFYFCVDVVLFHYLMFTSPITALVAMLDLYFLFFICLFFVSSFVC